MSTHILIQDPSNLSSRFSNKDRLGWDGDSDAEFDGLIEQNLAPEAMEDIYDAEHNLKLDFSAIDPYLPRIPDREADLITLYHKDKMKQEQIAKLFGITQAAVSYRLHRGIRRIQFLRTIPDLERDQFELELGPKFSDQDREILWRMYETTCQSEIAKQMRLTQGRVRHRFFRALAHIKDLIADEVRERQVEIQMEIKRGLRAACYDVQKEMDDTINSSKYAKYWTVFFAISDKHFNILHEVSLPQFRDRGDAQILPID
jgi:DNA-directed RNA polymerase specialized sigma24 family protein